MQHRKKGTLLPLSRLLFVGLLATAILGCGGQEEPRQVPLAFQSSAVQPSTEDDLRDAVELFEGSSLEQYTFATDVGERRETLVSERFVAILGERGQFEDLFNIGDEAFEAEHDREYGYGRGQEPGAPRAAFLSRVQVGELGGTDSSSCRSCHFNGGPDGAGTSTQQGLFRGDGSRVSSAVVREAPHVMGLGYVSILAREFEDELAFIRDDAARFSREFGEPIERELRVQGISFGTVVGHPDGSVDLSGVQGIGQDLLIRPFGFKGRHRTLVEVVDEALQLHHGLQSEARVDMFDAQASTYLGGGSSRFDRDDDGVQSEVSYGQGVLGASYLSMLGTPTIRPPANTGLALDWARGSRVFESVGCGVCHVAQLRFSSYVTEVRAIGDSDLSVSIDLFEAGQEPKPRKIDLAPDDQDTIPRGVPIFPFTDLKRHDMGPGLAEPVSEVLPDGSGEIPGSVWLTRSLWGVADTAPYLHDGRAPTLHDAITWHGGESAPSRDAYMDLAESDRAALRVFLSSLTRDGVVVVE